jgi:hypothetical protein
LTGGSCEAIKPRNYVNRACVSITTATGKGRIQEVVAADVSRRKSPRNRKVRRLTSSATILSILESALQPAGCPKIVLPFSKFRAKVGAVKPLAVDA